MTFTAIKRARKVPHQIPGTVGFNVINDMQDIGVYTRTAFVTVLIAASHPTGQAYDRPYQIDVADVVFIDPTVNPFTVRSK